MNKACAQAKIKHCGFHTLRKSGGAHLVMRGVQLSHVAKLLGHKSIRVTVRHYGHFGGGPRCGNFAGNHAVILVVTEERR
jgi:integrase